MTEPGKNPDQQPEQDETNEIEQMPRRWVKPVLYNFQRGIIQNGTEPDDVEASDGASYFPASV